MFTEGRREAMVIVWAMWPTIDASASSPIPPRSPLSPLVLALALALPLPHTLPRRSEAFFGGRLSVRGACLRGAKIVTSYPLTP
eukprot:scaffold74427_cov27-Tisochrysis_lutea.AAC.3